MVIGWVLFMLLLGIDIGVIVMVIVREAANHELRMKGICPVCGEQYIEVSHREKQCGKDGDFISV